VVLVQRYDLAQGHRAKAVHLQQNEAAEAHLLEAEITKAPDLIFKNVENLFYR
jgi:hypothetical protein